MCLCEWVCFHSFFLSRAYVALSQSGHEHTHTHTHTVLHSVVPLECANMRRRRRGRRPRVNHPICEITLMKMMMKSVVPERITQEEHNNRVPNLVGVRAPNQARRFSNSFRDEQGMLLRHIIINMRWTACACVCVCVGRIKRRLSCRPTQMMNVFELPVLLRLLPLLLLLMPTGMALRPAKRIINISCNSCIYAHALLHAHAHVPHDLLSGPAGSHVRGAGVHYLHLIVTYWAMMRCSMPRRTRMEPKRRPENQ